MATIRTMIELQDNFSSQIYQIVSATDMGVMAMEALRQSMNSAVDVSNMAAANEECMQLAQAANETAEYIQEDVRLQQQFNSELGLGVTLASRLSGMLSKMAVAYIGIQTLSKVTGLSDELVSTQARLNLLTDSLEETAQLQQEIFDAAQRSRGVYLDMSQTVAKLGLLAGDAFDSNRELVAFTELLNKNFVVGGASAQEQAAAMYQLTQAMASGRLQGDEYRSIIENAPLLASAIEDYMRNVQGATGSMKDWASEGLLTAEVIKNAMFSSADLVEERFSAMPMTFGQLWNYFGNQAVIAFQPVLLQMNELANNRGFQLFISAAISSLAVLAGAIVLVLNLFSGIGNVIADNWSWLEPMFMGAAGALAIYCGYLAWAKISELELFNATSLLNAAKTLAVPIYAMLTGQTMAETAAQWGLNSAMYACPALWLAGAFLVVFAAIVAVIRGLNMFGSQAHSVIGTVCGLVAAAGASIWNTFIGAVSAIIQVIWGIGTFVVGIIDWVVNLVQGGFDGILGGFENLIGQLLSGLLGFLKSFTGMWDSVFGTHTTDKVLEWQTKLSSWGKKEGALDLHARDMDISNYVSKYRIEYSAAWAAGNNFGDNLAAKFNFGEGLGDWQAGLNSNLFGGMADSLNNIAGSTAAMADSLSMTEEDLKYMRDIAEREAVNRFTTAEIVVNMGGITNNVKNNNDLDGIVDRVLAGTREAIEIGVEGVHI